MSSVKVALGFPWYNGPDVDTFSLYHEHMYYYGRLKERSYWLYETGMERQLPLLDHIEGDPRGELRRGEGPFEFYIAVETRMSLVGLARERLVDMALGAGLDWLFCWDADMRFPLSTFLRLWRHQKPVVGALAFTSRDPIAPCLYRMYKGYDPVQQIDKWGSETVWDFPDKGLITDEDIGGEIAFGAGVVLYNLNVFRQIPKPWFQSTGCGEDWFFCHRAARYGIPRYVDTSLDIQHKAHKAEWTNKGVYLQRRLDRVEEYDRVMKREGKAVQAEGMAAL